MAVEVAVAVAVAVGAGVLVGVGVGAAVGVCVGVEQSMTTSSRRPATALVDARVSGTTSAWTFSPFESPLYVPGSSWNDASHALLPMYANAGGVDPGGSFPSTRLSVWPTFT